MDKALLQQLHELRERSRVEPALSPAGFLAERIQNGKLKIPAADRESFVTWFVRFWRCGAFTTPPIVSETIAFLLEGRTVEIACDPWPDLGVLAGQVHRLTHAKKTYAISLIEGDVTLGRALEPELDWIVGDALDVLEALPESFDVIASVLPFGAKAKSPRSLPVSSGPPIRATADLASLLLGLAALGLSPDGIAICVVPASFFFTSNSIFGEFGRLGLGIEAALALPAGSFAPYTNAAAFLIVVRKAASERMFVAQLTQDSHTNKQIVENLRHHRADGPFELGRRVVTTSFRGLAPLRFEEQLLAAERRFGVRSITVGEIATDIRLGRPQPDFDFPTADNALFVPLIGKTVVVTEPAELVLKRQNYAQIVIDPARCDARFVARFLNSELGLAIREANQSGAFIPRLNSTTLRHMQLFVPSHKAQREILTLDQRVENERSILFGLETDLRSLERDLWSPAVDMPDVENRLGALSHRLAGIHPMSLLP